MKWRSLQESDESTDARPLHEIFAERKVLIAKYVPPETQAIHAQAVAELKASKVLGFVLNAVKDLPLAGGYYGYDGYDKIEE